MNYLLSILALAATLTWSDNSDNEDGFRVERSFDRVTWQRIGSTPANVSIYEDDTIPAGVNRSKYRVKAYNSHGDSGYSNAADWIRDSIRFRKRPHRQAVARSARRSR